ncbi:hypothetical protein [Escherichia coli]|uniref:Uncharacterized protein n=1 Tax=Escherichia phage 121Q TaxID=1555202 RepID=A0A097EYA7_9CAUD|nr:hypothetical protein PBI_121Q_500 [Escherichia phage 121Q]MDI0804442.1 hypothetical protein [Escherichia coli]MED6536396.1 hypothetical protein [Escherichia coli O157]QBO61912.1 hypothetical protein G17_00423 [Escherichia phage vB_EcoM_G17]WNN14739.1 hypothetical protein Sharanji_gp458 [Escherichia phage Sharanji]AIT14390.1 hypothetical protein PBI_121Q_500 [Escherichia phage 121Q]
MAFKIRADLKAMQQVTVQGKSTGLGVLGNNMTYYPTNSNGECTFPSITKDEVNFIVNGLPLTQYGELYDDASLNITSSGYSLTFNRQIPSFIGGYLYKFPAVSIFASTVSSGTQTQYVYATLVLGEPIYKISPTQIQESEIIMFIGTLTVGTSGITNININKVSRFSTYRPSVTQKGSSFPVSTGKPSETGTIGW